MEFVVSRAWPAARHDQRIEVVQTDVAQPIAVRAEPGDFGMGALQRAQQQPKLRVVHGLDDCNAWRHKGDRRVEVGRKTPAALAGQTGEKKDSNGTP